MKNQSLKLPKNAVKSRVLSLVDNVDNVDIYIRKFMLPIALSPIYAILHQFMVSLC